MSQLAKEAARKIGRQIRDEEESIRDALSRAHREVERLESLLEKASERHVNAVTAFDEIKGGCDDTRAMELILNL